METSFDKASENVSEAGLGDDEGSFLIAADYHHGVQLATACIMLATRVNGCEFV
jgi:hypothetical protein